MAILRERQVWKRASSGRKRKSRNQVFALTPEQHANVKAAMRALRMTQAQIAAAAGCSVTAIEKAMSAKGRPAPGLAIHVARLAQVPTDDVLSGAFPKAGHCPRCGWGLGSPQKPCEPAR
jgi:DNA-binding XRE family transcriptional regulator